MSKMLDDSQSEQYRAARESAAWFDYSSIDVLACRGVDGPGLLQRLTTNDLSDLQPGGGKYTVLLSEKARIIDVVNVVRRESDILLLMSPGAAAPARAWFTKYTIMEDFRTRDVSDDWRALQFFGPHAVMRLAELGIDGADDMTVGAWRNAELFGAPVLLIKQAPMCEFCFLLCFNAEQAEAVFNGMRAISAQVPQVDEDVYEVLRIEAGLGRRGSEWTDAFNPLEAGLVQYISFTKGCYIGQEVIARLDSYNKVKQRLIGFVSTEAAPPGAQFHDETRQTGVITSTAFSPELNTWISLGYLRSQYASYGARHQALADDGGACELEVVKLPFVH